MDTNVLVDKKQSHIANAEIGSADLKPWSGANAGGAFWEITHKFSVIEYSQLAEAGILREDDRLELIDGRIFDMPPIGSYHASCTKRILSTFVNLFQTKAIVSVQDPLLLDDFSEPQPDLMLLQMRADFYEQRHPETDDVFLLIEISDTSLEYDKKVKIPLYARAHIREVWLINLHEQCVEIYRSPAEGGYETITVLRGSQTLNSLAFPEISLSVAQLIGIPGTDL